jgi:hypothetical protein
VDASSLELLYRVGRIIELGVAAGTATLTVTRSRPLRPVRDWVRSKNDWWGELISCPYCMAHWIAAGLVGCQLVQESRWSAYQAFRGILLWLTVTGLASVTAKSIYLSIIQILPTQSEAYGKPKAVKEAA